MLSIVMFRMTFYVILPKNDVFLILLNLSATFNTTDRDILLLRVGLHLHSFIIRSNSLESNGFALFRDVPLEFQATGSFLRAKLDSL